MVTYWVSAAEDTVLVQSGMKALVRAATSVTVLPSEEEAKAPHDRVIPLTRKLFKMAVEEAIIRNIEDSQYHFNWDLLHQPGVHIRS